MRLAIVTVYCAEERRTLERCLASVRSQALPVEHFVIADGHPQDWLRDAGVRHVALDRAHGDHGDTPRMVGLVLAVREQFDAVQFLDADNLLYPQHAAMAAGLLRDTGAHLLVLKRRMLRPDGSVLNFTAGEDEALEHIDTNCYVFARAAFSTAIKWALIPKELSFMGDRVFRSVVSKVGHPVAVAPEPTVGCTCMWANVYRRAGEKPPPGSHDLSAHQARAAIWWSELDQARRDEIQVALGVRISVTPP